MPTAAPLYRPTSSPVQLRAAKPDNRSNPEARALYNAAWRKARRAFLELHPFCVECHRRDLGFVPAEVVDHIIPHRGDRLKFWDKDNWQPLCKRHHDIKTGRGQ